MTKQAWQTEDGSVFDTEEAAIEYESNYKIVITLFNHIKRNCKDAIHAGAGEETITDYIIDNWCDIKSIVEGDK